jgi:hypothetical protein
MLIRSHLPWWLVRWSVATLDVLWAGWRLPASPHRPAPGTSSLKYLLIHWTVTSVPRFLPQRHVAESCSAHRWELFEVAQNDVVFNPTHIVDLVTRCSIIIWNLNGKYLTPLELVGIQIPINFSAQFLPWSFFQSPVGTVLGQFLYQEFLFCDIVVGVVTTLWVLSFHLGCRQLNFTLWS